MAELELMAPGPLPGVPTHPPATLSPDLASASLAEEDSASLESPPGESGGQGSGSADSAGQEGPKAEGEEEEVLCDFCLGASRVRAVKSCLTCMVNYCPEHLRPHQENSKLHGHQLTEPTKDRDLRVCPAHRSPLVAFCCSDGQCICRECGQGEHRGHTLVSLDTARRDKEVSAGVPWGGGGEAARPGRDWALASSLLCLGFTREGLEPWYLPVHRAEISFALGFGKWGGSLCPHLGPAVPALSPSGSSC